MTLSDKQLADSITRVCVKHAEEIRQPAERSHNTTCQGGCGKVRSILCSDSPTDWLCNDCRTKHTHYIAMSGSHGCLPDSCNAYETYDTAINELADLFNLGRTRKARLFADRYLELTGNDGADYCSIDSCQCDKPWEHCDAGPDPRDWEGYGTIKEGQ